MKSLPDPEDAKAIPFRDLSDSVHQPIRLAVLTVLNEVSEADFTYLKKVLEVTDGNLGRHLEVLASGDLIELEKEFVGKRPRTWIRITKKGRSALALQVDAMRTIVESFDANH